MTGIENNQEDKKISLPELLSDTFIYQSSMMATGLVAQPFITLGLKMSLEKGLNNQSYMKTANEILKNVNKMFTPLTIGFGRRVFSAIPPYAVIAAIEKQEPNMNPLEKCAFVTILSTALGYKIDPQEVLSVVNAGKPSEVIKQRELQAKANFTKALGTLALRNGIYSSALLLSQSISNNVISEYGNTISNNLGCDRKFLEQTLPIAFQLLAFAATTSAQNLYGGYASGSWKSIPQEILNPQRLFSGAMGRTWGLVFAAGSLHYGKKIAGWIIDNQNTEEQEIYDTAKYLIQKFEDKNPHRNETTSTDYIAAYKEYFDSLIKNEITNDRKPSTKSSPNEIERFQEYINEIEEINWR